MTPAALSALASGQAENFMAAITPGGIEAQEKAGQIEQSFAETLPKDLRGEQPLFEKLGFVFGKDADDIFVNVTFPKGWRKKPTDHSMWSEILDDKGRKRGMIFYKAAFYDRSAHGSLDTRFSVQDDYGKPIRTISITDACGEIKEARPVSQDIPYADAVKIKDELWTLLKARFPDYENPLAYWE